MIGSKAFQVIGLELDMKSIFGKQKILKSVSDYIMAVSDCAQKLQILCK